MTKEEKYDANDFNDQLHILIGDYFTYISKEEMRNVLKWWIETELDKQYQDLE